MKVGQVTSRRRCPRAPCARPFEACRLDKTSTYLDLADATVLVHDANCLQDRHPASARNARHFLPDTALALGPAAAEGAVTHAGPLAAVFTHLKIALPCADACQRRTGMVYLAIRLREPSIRIGQTQLVAAQRPLRHGGPMQSPRRQSTQAIPQRVVHASPAPCPTYFYVADSFVHLGRIRQTCASGGVCRHRRGCALTHCATYSLVVLLTYGQSHATGKIIARSTGEASSCASKFSSLASYIGPKPSASGWTKVCASIIKPCVPHRRGLVACAVYISG